MLAAFHRLLQRQIKMHLGGMESPAPEIQPLLNAVNAAYHEFDADRGMLERSLELSSQELLEAYAHMQAVFHAFPDLFLWVDEQDAIIGCQGGGSAESYFGLPAPVGHRIGAIPQPEVRDLFTQALRQVRASNAKCRIEYTRPDQAPPLFCEARFVPLPGGKILAIVRDITSIKQAADRLRFHAQLLDGVRESIVATDLDGLIQYWGRGAEQLYGYSADEVMGKPYRNYAGAIHPPDETAFRQQVLATGSWRGEHVQRRKDGSTFWTSTVISVVLDPNGRPTGYIGMDQDISARKEAEESLRKSEERFRQVSDSAGEWIWEMDAHGLYTYSSPVVEQILGYKPEELVGKIHFYELFPPPLREKIKQAADERTSRKESFRRLANPVVHKDGHVVVLETTGVPILDAQGRLTGYRGTDTDITERTRAEEERERLQAQLNQAQKMESVGRLAGGVAHDFNNMLGVILGHVEMALDQMDPAHPLHSDLLEIQKAASRSADLTRQLLAYARKQTVAPRLLDLNETVESMLKMLRRMIGEEIDLAWRPGSNLGPVKIDPSQIDQILANLCVNARDAIQGVGTITIETARVPIDGSIAHRHPGVAPGEYVRLSVSDTGCGMDKVILANIFEPFFTTKEVGEGTGLGLATVYGAVRQNNGFIDVLSEPGRGSTFHIHLPLHQAKAESSPPPLSSASLDPGKGTILLVEDEPAMLDITSKMLSRLGFTVLTAATPGLAIHKAQEYPGMIDLLITDVIMPEMNGRDLARNLLTLYPNLKRLFMSGYTSEIIAHHGILEPGVFFIQKPFALKDLSTQLHAVFSE